MGGRVRAYGRTVFPSPAGAVTPLAMATSLHVRPFGRRTRDLDVEFVAGRAAVVTEVLRCCTQGDAGAGGDVERDVLWQLPVRARLHALVLVCLLTGWRELAWTVTCPAPGCGERAELALMLDQLSEAAHASAAREPGEVAWQGESFRPALPTGADLRRWSAEAPSDAELLAALGGPRIPDGEVPTALLESVEAALADADPLVDVRVQATCPGCGGPLDAPVDVEGGALALLHTTQEELVESVVQLAGAFGWSERAILELAPRRRRRYLTLLARTEA